MNQLITIAISFLLSIPLACTGDKFFCRAAGLCWDITMREYCDQRRSKSTPNHFVILKGEGRGHKVLVYSPNQLT